jgi:hypothetical protein
MDSMRIASLQQLHWPAEGQAIYERKMGGGRWNWPAKSGAGSARLRQRTDQADSILRGATNPTKKTGSKLSTLPKASPREVEAGTCVEADALDSARWLLEKNAMNGVA